MVKELFAKFQNASTFTMLNPESGYSVLRGITSTQNLSYKHSFRNSLLVVSVLAYLALEAYYLFNRFESHKSDLLLYHWVAVTIFEGYVPFRDFPLEYPLFALIPILVPQVFNAITGSTFEGYVFWFVVQNLAFAAVGGYLVKRSTVGPDQWPVYRYAALLVFSLPVFLLRFDPITAALTSFAVYYLAKKTFASGVALMVSVAVKLYCLVMFPAIVLFYIFNKRYDRCISFLTGACCVFTVVIISIFLIDYGSSGDFLKYHLQRGIHLESLAGGFLLLLSKMGLQIVGVKHSFGAYHLVTPASMEVLAFIKIITPLSFLALTCVTAMSFTNEIRSKSTVSVQSLVVVLTVYVLLFILLNKVFSPQYMIWLLPLIPFCGKRSFVFFTGALMLTVVIFPGHYHLLIAKQWYMVLLLNLRNGLLIALFINLIQKMGIRISYFSTESMRVISDTSMEKNPNSSVTIPRIL